MKRFWYVCADPGIPLPGSKGSSIHVESLCCAFAQAGLSGEVFAAHPTGPALAGLPLRSMEMPPRFESLSSPRRETALFLSGHDSGIDSPDRCDFIYERYSLWHTGGLARARALGVPFVLEVNAPLPEEAKEHRGLEHAELALSIARLLMEEANGLVCVSENVGRWAADLRGREEGIWIVPNGVDAELFSPGDRSRPSPLPPAGVPLVAFCGSFRPWHGTEDLLEAFRILVSTEAPEAHLLCIGDGPRRSAFEAQVRELGMSGRVHLTGAVPHEEVPRWLRGADVAVAPSAPIEKHYFSPIKVFEFMALGLPLVGGRIGQVSELLGREERGLTYRPGDPHDLAQAIGRLLNDRRAARRLADSARAWVIENATWSRRARSILGHLETP